MLSQKMNKCEAVASFFPNNHTQLFVVLFTETIDFYECKIIFTRLIYPIKHITVYIFYSLFIDHNVLKCMIYLHKPLNVRW